MGSVCLIAGILSPFFLDVAPEVRTTYVSLGKIVEDRPMQVTSIREGWDSERFGVRNVDDLRDGTHSFLL